MTFSRRRVLQLVGAAAAAPAFPQIESALVYPARPVRLVVGFPAGGPDDIIARLMGRWLSDHLAQPLIGGNRPRAGGNIGTETAVRAPPDGYTLLLIQTVNAINATLYPNL